MLEPILKETYGVIVYQEQVMQIAQVLSGYSLGEADLLRRAMGKKIHAEMDEQRARFVDGAVERGVDKAQADMIFDLLAKFADYGFNKSHAAAYALVSYQTAYLKANYPVEFLAASMTLDMGNTDKLADFRPRPAARHRGRAAVGQPSGAIRGGREHDLLCARGHQGRRRRRSSTSSRRAATGRSRLADFAARIDPRRSTSACWKAWSRPAPSTAGANRARVMAGIDAILAACQRARGRDASARTTCSAAPAAAPTIMLPQASLAAGRKAAARIRGRRLLPVRPSARRIRGVLERLRVQNWAEFSGAVKRGAAAGSSPAR